MTIQRLFSSLYSFLAPRRKLLYAATLALLAASALLFRRVHLEEDVASLLPRDGSTTALDFRLLQEAPFARKILIELAGDPGVPTGAVVDAAEKLASSLSPELFRPTPGQAALQGPGFLAWVAGALPALSTDADLRAIEAELPPGRVRQRLREGYAALLSPEGWALKAFIRTDPLAFRDLVFRKLGYLNLIPKMRMERGHFVSSDGRRVLLVEDTPVPITDSAGAARLVGHFDAVAARVLPPGVRASLLCGHRYTLANAEAIKRDLGVVLSLSFVAVLAVYLAYLRSRWAIFVFLVPSSVLVLASGALALSFPNVFAATLGFGGVLLGIADEYANYIFFALRRGGRPPAEIVGEASRPVLFGGLTTLGSLAVLFLSSLPGQRQLAVYSMTGIAASVLVSLVVLPHLIRPAPPDEADRLVPPRTAPRRRPWVVAVWLALLVLCASQVGRLHFNGDIRALGLVPGDLRAAEASLADTWGDPRGKALAFASGPDLEAALQANEAVFARLDGKLPAGELVSLAPILPSERTRRERLARWRAFWTEDRVRALRATVAAEGGALGFAPDAFQPFFDGLKAPSPPDGTAGLAAAGLSELTRAMVLRGPDGVKVVTLLPDTPAALALLEGPGAPKGVHVVSQSRFTDNVSRAVSRDFFRYLSAASALVLVLVVALFRQPRKVLLALVPVVTGLAGSFGGMALLGIDFNLFNIVATVLIIGICVDYGIYMVCRSAEGADHGGDRATLVSGLTTLAGLGVLVLARHPAMHSLGVTVLLGVGVAIPAALFVIPALSGTKE